MHVWLLALGLGIAAPVTAQTPLEIPKTRAVVTLDGRFDEPEWATAVELPLVGYFPVAGAPPSERTVFRMMHDGRAIYVAAELYDREPSGVQDWSRGRDDDQGGGDFANVLLDAFGDRENAVVFSTGPAGARNDYAISNDAEGPTPSSIAWNGFWDVRVRRDASGWFAEFRIPFATLRYQAIDGEVQMGVIVNRLIGRKNERVIYPAIPPHWSFGAFKPSRAQPVLFRGVETEREVVVVPYLATGQRHRNDLTPTGVGRVSESEDRIEAGGDLKLALTRNLNLDATVNTDFAEAEVDDQRINLGRYPVAAPERRQFFLERAGVFDFTLAGDNRLFNSRRIGLTEQGDPVPLHGGLRLLGRIGGVDMGLLDMQTKDAAGQGSTNYGVLRLRSRVLNPESYVGVMATTRASADARAVAGGVDGALRIAGPHYVRLAAALADAAAAPSTSDVWTDRLGWNATVERRSTVGLGGSLGVLHLGTDFATPVGFIESAGIRRIEARTHYGVLAPPAWRLRLLTPTIQAMRVTDLAAGALQTTTASASAAATLRSGAHATLGVERRREITQVDLLLPGDLEIPPGDYASTIASAVVGTGDARAGSLTAEWSSGGFYGGRRTSVGIRSAWRPTPPLTTAVEYLHERIGRDTVAAALTLVRLRVSVAPSIRHAGTATVQHSTASHLTRVNARWRVNFREATDLWLVYDRVLNTERDRTMPALARTALQTIHVKLTYAFAN